MATLSIRNITSISFEWQVTGMESIDIKSSVALSSEYYGTGVSSIPVTSIFSSVLIDNYQTSIDWTTYTSGQSYFSWNPGETFTVYAYRYTSAYYYIGSYTINTPSYNPTTPSAPVSATRIVGGFNLSWGFSSGATSYDLYYTWYSGQYSNTITGITSTSYTLTGLLHGTTYTFQVRGRNSYGVSAYTTANEATTMPKIPTVSQGTVSSNSITVNISDMEGNYTGVRVYLYNNLGTQINYDDTFTTATFTGLTADTTYYADARSYLNISGTTIWSNYSNRITIRTTSNRPTNWSWTITELNAFNNHGLTTTLTYTRWNAFIDKVQEFINYYNTKYGTGVPSVTQYKMTSSNKILTATAFNNIRFSIGSMNPTGISNISTGDTVYGSYFTTLSNKLNGIS